MVDYSIQGVTKIDYGAWEEMDETIDPTEKVRGYNARIRSRKSMNDSPQKARQQQELDVARHLKELTTGRNLDETI